jgi:hypothetical protein
MSTRKPLFRRTILAILALLLTGCASLSTSQPPAPTPEPASPTPDSSRLVVTPESITRVDELLTKMTHDGTFTGSVLSDQDGVVFLALTLLSIIVNAAGIYWWFTEWWCKPV